MRTRPRSLAALLAVLAIAAGCGGEPEAAPTVTQLTAQPLEEPVREPEPTVPTSSPDPSPSPTPTPSPSASPSPSGPSEAEKARYAAAYAPEGSQGVEHVAIDLDADGIEELLFTYVRERRSRVDVAAWDGAEYRVVADATGGAAQRIERVRVGDVNADGRTEIVTFEADETGASLTAFAAVGADSIVGLRAVGGCYDGSATYGVVGAELRDTDGDGIPEIVARCDDSPLPVSAWSEETYRWEDGAYRVVREQPSPSPSPSPGPSPSGSEGDDGASGDD